MSEPRITRETRGHVLLIGLDRAKKKNAFDRQMLRELSDAYNELERTDDLRCGVVFAHGADFTAGLDLADVAPAIMQGDRSLIPEGAVDPWGVFGPACSKPVIVAAQGLCLTLGIELLLASDIRLAASNARFAQIEIKRGIFPFGGGTMRWPAQVGWGNAMRWLLTGDELSAAEALRIGLVQEVVEPDRLLARAVELGEAVAAQAPLGVQATLRSARKAGREGFDAASKVLADELVRLMQTEDAAEGMASFLERRAAKFSGR